MQPSLDVFGLSVQTFGLCLGLSAVLCGLVAARRLRELGKPVDWAYEMVFAAYLGGIVGSRLWWVAEHPDELADDVLGTLFGGSGLTFYGGLLGGAVAVCLWARRRGMLGLGLLDLAAPILFIGYAAGRVGCQVSGDGDYGQGWDGPWAMAYPDGAVPIDTPVHPTPVYETLAAGVGALALWHLRDRFAPGRLFALYLVLAGVERFLVELIRRNDPVLAGLTTAQVVSVAMAAAGAAWLLRRRPEAATS